MIKLPHEVLALAYLAAAALFILGLKGLTHPASARRGNLLTMAGMAVAILATLMHPTVHSYGWILAGIVLGAIIGTGIALRIRMTAMPQLVACCSFVGLAAVLVAIGTFSDTTQRRACCWPNCSPAASSAP
jgi:NAD(P) transhydrogenase subunit beta